MYMFIFDQYTKVGDLLWHYHDPYWIMKVGRDTRQIVQHILLKELQGIVEFTSQNAIFKKVSGDRWPLD